MAPPAVVGFSDLPTEALDEIARRVGPLDNVLCSAVCRPWRRALRTTRLRLLGRRPGRPHHMCLRRRGYRYSWDIPVVKISPYHIDRYYDSRGGRCRCPVETVVDDEVARSRIIGSAYGWAVTVDDDTWAMSLLDPFTARTFPLPPFTDSLPGKQRPVPTGGNSRFWRHMFRKAALAPGRRLGTYAVMLLHSNGRGLSYLAPGATSWSTLRPPRGMPHKYMDVIFHKGAFYTVSCYAELNAWVPNGDGGLRTRRLTSPQPGQVWSVLTESMSRDGILMVSSTKTHEHGTNYHNYYSHGYWQRPYKVHRYAESERRWIAMENLDGMTVMVGEGCSFCVPGGGNYDGFGHRSVQASGCHWFFPYVARLDHAFS
ncbi:hypothetical protein VPH35_099091 [Triticum aestivum]